ncbi:hypothetical protein K449DRAFT_436508 [Hypoxylon sp. EC38]|nr:hypothetical protein K449DRAFT_436508 [Hypoxylon sp. EC38]
MEQCCFPFHLPHSFHIAKVMVNGLKTARSIMINLVLADIYYFAAEKISMCEELEPEDFLACDGNLKLGEGRKTRKYDVFKSYRKTVEDKEEDNAGGEDRVEEDGEDNEDCRMGEADEENQLPHIKKLKIADQ